MSGEKTQTRRVVKQPEWLLNHETGVWYPKRQPCAMSDDTREREITRKALVLCLSHPVDCDCRGCRDIYGLLQPGEPVVWPKRWGTLAGRAALLAMSMDPTLQRDGQEILRQMAAVEEDIPVLPPTPIPDQESRDLEAMADKVSGILWAVARGHPKYVDASHYTLWDLIEKDLRAAILGKEPDHE